MGRYLTRSLAHRATAVAAELARTPGTWLIRVDWTVGMSVGRRHGRPQSLSYSRETLPALLDAPDDAVGFRIAVSGAFEPTRPTDTDGELHAELTRLRQTAHLPDLPAGTIVQCVGRDDVGFFAYQLTLAQTADDPIAVPMEMLRAAG